ncbi:MAG TPA: glycosyltransferase family 4 protein [Kofleriaceae bacterium]|nr:glycosyltransferase family 4 protein [Kofleriaceae bacterium]
MKLGVITTSYPRFPGDPAGSFVAGHVEAMRALGHDVEVIAAGDRPAARAAYPHAAYPHAAHAAHAAHAGDADDATPRQPGAVIRVGGAGLFYRGGAPDALERAPLAAGAAAAVFTARLIAEVARHARRWDAMFAHWLVPSAIAALPGARPLVAIVHGGDLFTLRRLRLLRPVLGALHRRRAHLVFVGEHLRAIARDAAPALAPWLERATIQPMGISLAHATALAAARRVQPGPRPARPIILVVARLVPIKGVDVAIAAMAHVTAAAELVIAGDGPERARLSALSASPAAPRWRLLGEVTAAERDALLVRAAAVVVPSRVLPNGRTEGTPLIALEALAAGVPVIASAVGGLAELPGVIPVAPDDPAALGRAIDRVLADPPDPDALRAGVAGLDRGAVATRLLALLRE